MNTLLVILFFIVVVLAFFEDYLEDRHKLYALLSLAAVMVVICATKEVGVDPDSEIYEDIFLNNDDLLYVLSTEPSYIYISRMVLAVGGTVSVMFLIYSLISVPTKLFAIRKLTPFCFLALALYIPVYYELHDLIQIRAAAATAMLLIAIPSLHERRWRIGVPLMLVATVIHYSTIMALPLLYFGNKEMNTRWRMIFACIVPLGFMFYMVHIDILSLIPSSLFGGKLDFYKNSAETGAMDEMITPYKNVYFMLKCILYLFMLYYYEMVKKETPYITILLKYMAVSIFAMFAFSNIPTLATRTSDLFGVVDPIVFTYSLYLTKQPIVPRIGVILLGAYMLVFNIVVSEYFT